MKKSQETWPPAPEHGHESYVEGPAIDDAHPVIKRALNALNALFGVVAGTAYWVISWVALELIIGHAFPSMTPIQCNYSINAVQGIAGVLMALALMNHRIKFGLYLLVGILISGLIGVAMEIDTQTLWQ